MSTSKHKDCSKPDKNIKNMCRTTRLSYQATDTVTTGSMRLNRAIATAGFCSRRKADEYIQAGRVTVNGQLQAHPGLTVAPEDIICIDGQSLSRERQLIYIMMNKPVHTLCTAHDPDGRQTIFDLLPARLRQERLFSVGRLDYFSEGLLILTNDGKLSQHLAHPGHEQTKIYEALVREQPDRETIEAMRNGMTLDNDLKLLPVEITATQTPAGPTLLTMTLRQGINRQIRRMCKKANLTILRLRRIAQGPLRLGNLPPGKIRHLSQNEINKLININ